MNLTNRREQLQKLKKDQVIDVCLSHWDNMITLENTLTDHENKHKAEMRGLRESYQAGADEVEKEYNNSHCYKYVTQLLLDLKFANSDLEYQKSRVKDLEENHHQDLKKENQELRNKIVRMA